jgi:signal transduction histidine kinase
LLVLSIILSLAGCIVIGAAFTFVIKNRQLLKKLKESETSYEELAKKCKAVNKELEARIQNEVAANRERDLMLLRHSRLAAMGEIIASLGHQWRQPLNSLSLLIQDVSEALEFGEIDDQYIESFTKESMVQIKLMSRTINDFRKFYTINNEKSYFSIGDSISDALSMFSSSLTLNGIHVDFEYRGQQMAYGFPNEFSQVLLNILTNAKEAFIEKNITDRKLSITLNENETFVSAEIIDNAGGISSDAISHVFDPYYTTREHGTGLGLFMTKMILEKMDGRVSVENTGEGVKFTLAVPKAEVLTEKD